jgi:hypothetical protein
MNVTYLCIVAPFEFLFPMASKELRITRLYTWNNSFKDVLSVLPFEWTPTAKVIAIPGIVLGITFLHSFELIHDGLKPGSVFLMNTIDFKLQTLDEVDLIRTKLLRLRAE